MAVPDSWTSAGGDGGSIGLDSDGGGRRNEHGRDRHDTYPAARDPRLGRRCEALSEPPRDRGYQKRDRCEQQEVCGPRGHQQPPEGVGLDVSAWRESLDDEKGSEPAREQRGDRRTPDSEHCDHACDRRPLRDPSAPEELAQVVHLPSPVVEVELDVAIEVDRETPRSKRAESLPARPPGCSRGPCPSRTPGRGRWVRVASAKMKPPRHFRAAAYASTAPTAKR